MGSQNLIEPGYNKASNHKGGREYVELVARIDGPDGHGAARGLREGLVHRDARDAWAEDIAAVTPAHHDDGVAAQILPSGPGYVTENNLRLYTALIYSAQKRISVTSPYFVPDEPLLYALTTAAQRGVAVELFVSEEGDQFMVFHAQCSYYQALLEAGIRIYRYPSPAVLHSKYFSIDDDVAVIGSSNMDMRSFALNHEVSMMVTGRDIVARFREVEDDYRALSKELTIERVARAVLGPALPRQRDAADRRAAVAGTAQWSNALRAIRVIPSKPVTTAESTRRPPSRRPSSPICQPMMKSSTALTASVRSRATLVSMPTSASSPRKSSGTPLAATSGQPSRTILRRSPAVRSRCTRARMAIQCTYVSAAQ